MAVKVSLTESESHPLAIEAFNFLSKQGLIYPGSVVSGGDVEKCLGRKYEPNNWKFLGPYLLLKSKLESEGYFITQDDMEAPAFRILRTEEMASFAQKKLLKNLTSNFKIGYILAAHDYSKLNEAQLKNYKSVQQKAAQTAIIQQKILLEDMFF